MAHNSYLFANAFVTIADGTMAYKSPLHTTDSQRHTRFIVDNSGCENDGLRFMGGIRCFGLETIWQSLDMLHSGFLNVNCIFLAVAPQSLQQLFACNSF